MDLSIIIPHKNSSSLLERLLMTIPADDLWQIIVVDDNSSTEERDVVKSLQQEYKFELYDNLGIGAGGARNTGLLHAIGDWVFFSDSDDYFYDALKPLFEKYKKCDSDIVYFNVDSCISESGSPANRHLHTQHIINRYKETCEEGYLRCKYLTPWGKMIKRKLLVVNNIRFEERKAGNDMWFAVQTGIMANKILCDETIVYCVTVSCGSITTTVSIDRFEDRLQATLRVNKFIRAHGLGKYQTSLLYFMGKAYQFGLKYTFHVWWTCLISGTNLFIGTSKLLHINSVLEGRQNKKYIIKE